MLRPRSLGLLLAFATLLVFLPTTWDQFINFDDPNYVTENPVVQNGLTWAGVKWAFSGVHVSNWHPVTWLSHMLDCALFRLNPAGPHLINNLFHSVNAALLLAWLWQLTKKLWPSAFVAALFAWHPLHVESVAWISERKDVLCTFFALLTLLAYSRHAENAARNRPPGDNESLFRETLFIESKYFWLAVLFFALALLAKPMPVTLPVVMLLLDGWPLKRMPWDKTTLRDFFQLTLEKWPFWLLTAGTCLITVLAQDKAISPLAGVPLSSRLENVLSSYALYLWKMVWPLDLAIFYPLQMPIAGSVLAGAAVVLTGVSALVWLERKASPWLIVGWLWFLISLLPVIGLVQVGSQAMADRYSYFPLIGIFWALTWTIAALADRFKAVKPALLPGALLILAACVSLTEKQIGYWYDSETLFTHSLAVADSETGHMCLGAIYEDQSRRTEAMNQYLMALRLNHSSERACGRISKLLADEGKNESAAFFYRQALQRNPEWPYAHQNLGIILIKLGRFEEAMAEFAAEARRDPGYAQPHFLMGRLALQRGLAAEALPHLREGLRLDPENVEQILFLASVLAAAEDARVRNGVAAGALVNQAVKLSGGQHPAVLDVQAMVYAETGQFAEAIRTEQQALKLATAGGQTEDLALMQRRLERYQRQAPWRESFKKN